MNLQTIGKDWVGRTVDDRFPLLQWLGGSERGNVFLTELPGEPLQKAAIKLIPVEAGDAETDAAGWERTKALAHPHLMRLFDGGRCQIDDFQLIYSVTEYADEALSLVLPERPLTETETREMLTPVLDALSYLHEKGLVHGHLKPSNILVVNDQLKLSSDRLHVAGERGSEVSETEIHDAPEAFTGAISPAADIWGVGVLVVEALTQPPPVWQGTTEKELVVPESLSQPFAGIARECLRTDAAMRCTISDIRVHLDPAAAQPKLATRALPEGDGESEKAAATKSRVTAFVCVVLVLLVIFAAMQLRMHKTAAPESDSQQSEPAITAPSPKPAKPTPNGGTHNRIKNGVQNDAQGGAQSGAQSVALNGAVVERVLPEVLESARVSIRGQVNVVVRVTVDGAGNVANATIESAGPSSYFAKVSLQAAQRWRFKPRQAGGQAVSSEWLLRFKFTQSGVESVPVEVSTRG